MDPLNQVRSCHLLCPKERYEKEKEHTKPAKISGQSFQFNYRIVKTSCFNENSNNLHSLFHCSKKEGEEIFYDVHYDVMYPTGKNLKESLKDRVSNKKRYLGRTQVKTPPPLASLHAGEAFCRRRRVLCSFLCQCSRRLHHRHLAEPSHRYRLPCYSLGRHRLSVSSPHHRPTSQGKQKHQIYSLRVWSRWSAHMLVLTESPLDTRPKPPLFRPFPSPVIVKVTRQVPSPPKRLVSPPTPNLEPLDENLQGFNSTDLLIGTIILLLWSTQLRWNIVSQPVPSSRPILEYHQEHLFTSATPSLPSYASPLFCIPLQLPQLLHRQIRSSTVRFTIALIIAVSTLGP
uniref:Uncharacterized protein n=1 Tax=Brassica oleracea TaxID=3712 RepID=A0A3P6GDY2_BRAOL|nr:unnamed protein product [Brassica oleracea]